MSAKKAVEFIEVEVFLVVNYDGEYEVATDENELDERWAGSDYQTGIPARHVLVKLRVPKPKPTVVTATLPEESTDDVEALVS